MFALYLRPLPFFAGQVAKCGFIGALSAEPELPACLPAGNDNDKRLNHNGEVVENLNLLEPNVLLKLF